MEEEKKTTKASKMSEILSGWKNFIFINDEVEKLATTRAEICAGCKFNVNSRCKKCGCPLIAKTRSPHSRCPLNKW